MKLILVACFIGLAFGQPIEDFDSPIVIDYHNVIGIKEAARIKAAEESSDFDGSRIVGGSAARLGQYPFVGGLIINLTTGQTSVCGSSLISNTRAVTAAHCWRTLFSQATQFTVVLGSVTLFSGGTRVVTNQVVTHPNYGLLTANNDIAVIAFSSSVSYTNNIRNIALAPGSANYVGEWANAIGFGAQRDGSGISTNQQLHHVRLQVITNAECQRTYGTVSVISSTICTSGANGRSTCGGDSGGPLEHNNVLIGVTSFGHRDGCEIGHPAGFARVTSFRSWVEGQM